MYKIEELKLKSLIDEEVWELLKDNKAIIAGGAITSLFTNKEINDLDIYLPSQRAVVNILAEAFNVEDLTETPNYLRSFQLRFINITDKSILFKNLEQDIQLITFKHFNSPEEIFNTFDFTCCMGAFDLSEDKFIFHPEFFKHCSQRYLKFNPDTAFPLISALRVDKYREKGYDISKAEYLKILFTCIKLDINSWDDVKEHIGGMYGYNMDEFFDEEKEFSLSEVISQMDEREYDPTRGYGVLTDFEEILNKFDPAKEIELSEPDFKKGFFYKHVGENMLSNSWGEKIDYSVGNIVEGGKEGIFIHANPKKPWQTKGICIELEPIGEHSVKYSTELYDTKKAQLFGKAKVTRIVPFWESDLTKAEIKYRVKK